MNEQFWSSSIQELFHQPLNQQNFEKIEVIDILGIKPYQLRFWESEFDCIRSNAQEGIEIYSANDLKVLLRIKKLLMEDQLTIEKAKALLDVELKLFNQMNMENNTIPAEVEIPVEVTNDIPEEIIYYADNNFEDSMNMNAIYEEMSVATFNQAESNQKLIESSYHQDEINLKVKAVISKMREALKNWGC